MLVRGYDFSLKMAGTPPRSCLGVEAPLCAHFRLDTDISQLFPYINSVAESPAFFEKPLFIRFILGGILCGLHPDHGMASPFADRDQALDFLELLLVFLNDIHRRRDDIEPNHKRWKPVPVLDNFRLLPMTNCRQCGHATCLAFAAALSKQHVAPECCPALVRPISQYAVYPVLDKHGNVLSTVAVDLGTDRARRTIAEPRHIDAGLKEKPTDLSLPLGTAAETGNSSLPVSLTDREL